MLYLKLILTCIHRYINFVICKNCNTRKESSKLNEIKYTNDWYCYKQIITASKQKKKKKIKCLKSVLGEATTRWNKCCYPLLAVSTIAPWRHLSGSTPRFPSSPILVALLLSNTYHCAVVTLQASCSCTTGKSSFTKADD